MPKPDVATDVYANRYMISHKMGDVCWCSIGTEVNETIAQDCKNAQGWQFNASKRAAA